MEKLTAKEEEIMQALWTLDKAFVKDILVELPGKPHYNTVSTLIRKMQDKGFVGHEAFGKTHRYYPIIPREQYRNRSLSRTLSTYFNSSPKNMVSFFAKEQKISAADLREILEMMESDPNTDFDA